MDPPPIATTLDVWNEIRLHPYIRSFVEAFMRPRTLMGFAHLGLTNLSAASGPGKVPGARDADLIGSSITLIISQFGWKDSEASEIGLRGPFAVGEFGPHAPCHLVGERDDGFMRATP